MSQQYLVEIEVESKLRLNLTEAEFEDGAILEVEVRINFLTNGCMASYVLLIHLVS